MYYMYVFIEYSARIPFCMVQVKCRSRTPYHLAPRAQVTEYSTYSISLQTGKLYSTLLLSISNIIIILS